MKSARRQRRSVDRALPSAAQAPSSPIGDWLAIAVLIACIALVIFVRLRLAGIPLERDEGEYAYAGRLILDGVPPYAAAGVYNMKFPGTYYAYAALMSLFGQTAWGIRFGLLWMHLATVGILFMLTRRLTSIRTAAFAASAFALLAVDRWSLGVFAHATHFALLPGIAGLLVLIHAVKTNRSWLYVCAGALMAIAICMKQQAMSFFLVGIVLAAAGWPTDRDASSARWQWRQAGLFVLGPAVVGLLLFFMLLVQGVFPSFWKWTIQYGLAYVSQTPASVITTNLGEGLRQVLHSTTLFWLGGAAGLACVLMGALKGARKSFVLAWLVASVLAVTPGFFFRPHYFILLMPVVGLMIGILVATLERAATPVMGPKLAVAAPALAFVLLATPYFVSESRYLLRMDQDEVIRSLYITNPFLEAPIVGDYLKAQTTEQDKIAVLGSEPEILFYAHRRSATGFVYMYPLMEQQPYAARMQQDVRREVVDAKPAYLVLVGIPASWRTTRSSDTWIQEWASRYASSCFDLVGLSNVSSKRGPIVYWGADALRQQPQANSAILIYKRRVEGACNVE